MVAAKHSKGEFEMTTEFAVESEQLDGGVALIALRGEVDIYTAPRFKERLIQVLDGGVRALVVDLSGVTFIDSTALGVMIGGVRRIHDVGGSMALVVATRPVERVLSVTGLDRVFIIHGTREEAVAAVGGA
jgi:anti-sigma B factor antagonist